MSSFTDLTTAEVFLMGLNMLGACFAFAVTLLARRRLAAQVGMPGAVRLLGVAVVVCVGLLSGCTTQKRGSRAAGVDAKESPKGRYYRLVTGAVEKKWLSYSRLRRDGLTYGRLKIVFFVTKKGKVEDLRIVDDKESNSILTGFTLQAIKDADIPRMPADVIPSLPMNDPERLKIEYNVLIY